MQIISTSPDETKALGRALASSLKPGDVVVLSGTLGTGKTRFVQGVCEVLGVRTHVSSPTFTLINEYPVSFGKIVHIDLYRIAAPAELAQLGIEEYFTERCLCLVEWPELLAAILPPQTWRVSIDYGTGETDRVITIDGGPTAPVGRDFAFSASAILLADCPDPGKQAARDYRSDPVHPARNASEPGGTPGAGEGRVEGKGPA
ncbi:MAG TPA: tRNA (adenosine(37)-N6)-threonylcarbamoyltransferase complex ATPase subunit type 1 TsaE [Bacteroidota bacterium]